MVKRWAHDWRFFLLLPLGVVGLGVLFSFLLPGMVRWRRGPSPEAIWAAAEADFRAGRWERAEVGLDRLARVRTPTVEDWILRGQVAMARGQIDEALADLARVPDNHRLAPQVRLKAGQLELRRERPRAAEHLLRQAVALDPTLVQAWRELIYIYGIQLRRAELGRAYEALARLVPLTYDDVFIWCLTRGVNWDPAEQVKTLSRYVETDPTDRDSRLALAENLQLLGRLDEANAILAPLPDSDHAARAARARLAIDRGDLRAAEGLLTKGPEDDPALARLRGRLALLHGKAEDAIRHFRAADAAEPNHRDTLIGLAQALQLAGQTEEGKAYARRVRDHDQTTALVQKSVTPEGHADATMYVRLGRAYAKIGRLPEARAWLKLAIQRDPLDAEAQQALHQIGKSGAP
jgi:tetratricopeptide (TPR) repeat protein